MRPLTFANAMLVLPDGVRPGSLAMADGLIASMDGTQGGDTIDLDGDYLLPGAVDLHTDNLERQVQPRSGARWPSRSAFLAHDMQCAACGITTVLDALCVGDLGFDEDRLRTTAEGVVDLDTLAPTGLLKSEHFLHLRCELPAMGMIEQFAALAGHPRLRLVSLMDHTPGIGQYADIERYARMRRRDGEEDSAILRRIDQLRAQRDTQRGPNRAALLDAIRAREVAIASHDDRTEEDIAENIADGIAISEFPVTERAARAARDGGMRIIGGAPNLVRGGSHTGNVAVLDLLRAGLIDALASDYVPSSLIEAAFAAAASGAVTLADGVALVTSAPAEMLGLTDRGRLAPGTRADLVRVRVHDGVPVVRCVWLRGERVA